MDRQEQIMEAARKCPKHNSSCNNAEYLAFINGAEWADQHPTPQKLADAYVSGFVDAIEQPSPWISVEERLPENGDFVLAMSETTNADGVFRGFLACKYTGGKFLHEIRYSFSDSNGVFYKMSNEMIVFDITHWMPIPPIEKGGEK